jgi:hypothetical protein
LPRRGRGQILLSEAIFVRTVKRLVERGPNSVGGNFEGVRVGPNEGAKVYLVEGLVVIEPPLLKRLNERTRNPGFVMKVVDRYPSILTDST